MELSIGEVVELSNRQIVDQWKGGLVVWWCGGVVELSNRRIVEWWNGQIVE